MVDQRGEQSEEETKEAAPHGVPAERGCEESVRQTFRSTLIYRLMLIFSEVKLQVEVGLISLNVFVFKKEI